MLNSAKSSDIPQPYTTNLTPQPSTPTQTHAPKSLSELLKDKEIGNRGSMSTRSQSMILSNRISSDPLIAWGDTGGPGKAQSVSFKSTPSHHKPMAPPFSHSRRQSLSVTGSSSDFPPNPLTNPDTPTSFKILASQSSSNRPSPSIATTSSSSSVNEDDDKISSAMRSLYNVQDRHIVDSVFRDVVQKDLGVSFDDIAALDVAKRLLNEAVILPLIMPEFFTGIREPWRVS
jgi:SpoVK/Ycf46/Vps4 family AAA+-type ATPase